MKKTEGTDGQSSQQPIKYTPEQFLEEFKKLCDRMGYQLIATPVWLGRDDSTFSTKINWSVGELPKQ